MFVGLCMQAGLKCVGSRQMAELNSAHTAANGLNFDSLGKRRIKVLCHHIFHVTHGRNVVTTRRKEKLLQSSFLHNFRKFSIENRTLKCKRDGLKCVEEQAKG